MFDLDLRRMVIRSDATAIIVRLSVGAFMSAQAESKRSSCHKRRETPAKKFAIGTTSKLSQSSGSNGRSTAQLLRFRSPDLARGDAEALATIRRSLELHGRARAARAIGWPTLIARIDDVGSIDAKLRLRELHDHRGLTELEEAWLVRSLYREDRVSQPEIARLGLIAPRAAVAVSRLPRGNQQAASAVVVRRGLTVRQTDALVNDALDQPAPTACEALLARRLDGPAIGTTPGPRSSRVARSDVDRVSLDILRVREIAARLEARLLSNRGTQFRIWATQRLREYIIKGFTLDDERLKRAVAATTSTSCSRVSATSVRRRGCSGARCSISTRPASTTIRGRCGLSDARRASRAPGDEPGRSPRSCT